MDTDSRAMSRLFVRGRNCLPFFFYLFFFYWPLAAGFYHPAEGSGGVFALWEATLSSPIIHRAARFTLGQAFLSALLSVLLAFPGAYLLSHYPLRGKKVILSLALIPFVTPPILAVLGFVLFWGNNGLVNQILMTLGGWEKPPLSLLYSFKAILLAHVFYNFPLALRLLTQGWEQIPSSQRESSRVLGASPLRRFLTIDLPLMRREILTAFLLIFLYCFMSFAIILVLGGGPRFSTLEVEVYRASRISLAQGEAGMIALLETFFTLSVMVLYFHLNPAPNQAREVHPQQEERPRPMPLWAIAYFLLFLILLFGPILALVLRSLQEQQGWHGQVQWSFRWYTEILQGEGTLGRLALPAIKNSLLLAVSTVLLGQPLALLAALFIKESAHPRQWGLFFLIPMGVSSLILALGYQHFLPATPLSLALLHILIAMPLSIRILQGGLDKIDSSLLESASLLGSSPGRRFLTVTLPLLFPALLTSSSLAFALSMGELNGTLMLGLSRFPTIPVILYQLIGAYRFYSACALGMILVLLSGISFYLLMKNKEATL